MKTFCLSTLIVLFLLLNINITQAQPTNIRLNRDKLLKQIPFTLKATANKDILDIAEEESLSTGMLDNNKISYFIKEQFVNERVRVPNGINILNLAHVQSVANNAAKVEIPYLVNKNILIGKQLKAASTGTENPDSIINAYWDESIQEWNTYTKFEGTYDANGKTTLWLEYEWDKFDSVWVGIQKEENTYDETGNNTIYIKYGWDESTSQWIGIEKKENTYDVNGNNTLFVYYNWQSPINKWVATYKAEYTYDVNGNETLSIDYNWDENTSQWVLGVKVESTYDAYGIMTLAILYSWSQTTTEWIASSKDEYTYDENGNNTVWILYFWNIDTSQWTPYLKTESNYDTGGNRILYNIFSWEKESSQYYTNYKEESTFDTKGNITWWVVYKWNVGSYQWIITWNKYIYDVNGKLESDIFYLWNDTTNNWDFKSKMIYTYDVNGNKKMEVFSNWNGTTSQWIYSYKATYYYPQLNPTLIPGISERQIYIYPNPTKEYIVFDLPVVSSSAIVELFDLQGKKVMEQKLFENKQMSVSSLPKGMYIYKLNNSGNFYTGKVIIE